jgi:hypothetical protein
MKSICISANGVWAYYCWIPGAEADFNLFQLVSIDGAESRRVTFLRSKSSSYQTSDLSAEMLTVFWKNISRSVSSFQ